MDRGYIKLWRKSLDSGLIKNHKLWAFWCWCLMKATHKEIKIMVGNQEISLKPGQFVFGRKAAAKETGLSERTVRTCLAVLKTTEKTTIKTTNKFSLISIVNWHTYQQDNLNGDHQNDQRVTSKRPASDQQVTTNKNVRTKECKNILNNTLQNEFAEQEQEEFYMSAKKRKLSGKRLESFNRFWECFDYKKGKAEAADSWLNIQQMTNSLVDTICAAAKKEAENRKELIKEGRTPKMAQGWLTARRWEDEETGREETPEEYAIRRGLM